MKICLRYLIISLFTTMHFAEGVDAAPARGMRTSKTAPRSPSGPSVANPADDFGGPFPVIARPPCSQDDECPTPTHRSLILVACSTDPDLPFANSADFQTLRVSESGPVDLLYVTNLNTRGTGGLSDSVQMTTPGVRQSVPLDFQNRSSNPVTGGHLVTANLASQEYPASSMIVELVTEDGDRFCGVISFAVTSNTNYLPPPTIVNNGAEPTIIGNGSEGGGRFSCGVIASSQSSHSSLLWLGFVAFMVVALLLRRPFSKQRR